MIIFKSSSFKKDLKKLNKSGNLPTEFKANLEEFLQLLINNKPIPIKFADHPLKGDYKGYRDCHICSDIVLIYSKNESTISLYRLTNHSGFLNKKNPSQ